MDTTTARKLFENFASSMAYVWVKMPDGTDSIGSAFHVGDGVFVTARHVVDGNAIIGIATTETCYAPAEGEQDGSQTATRSVSPYIFSGRKG